MPVESICNAKSSVFSLIAVISLVLLSNMRSSIALKPSKIVVLRVLTPSVNRLIDLVLSSTATFTFAKPDSTNLFNASILSEIDLFRLFTASIKPE